MNFLQGILRIFPESQDNLHDKTRVRNAKLNVSHRAD